MQTLDLTGTKVGLLGDPHLGRRFVNNVPLHRRGDHEKLVNAGFRKHLIGASGLDFHVCMGDLFDRPVVTPETVMFAADCYVYAAQYYPRTRFVVLAGNHDLAKDLDAVNSFDLFSRIVDHAGILCVRNTPVLSNGLLFVPYGCAPGEARSRAAFGHWDLVNPTSSHNLVPKLDTGLYVTGHDHVARVETRHGIKTICTGSMQAYAHGEGEPYRTVTLAELEAISDTHDLCLRVVLAEGEELPEIDALQVSVKREKQEENLDLDVGFEGFDMQKIFSEIMQKNEVGEQLISELSERYRNRV